MVKENWFSSGSSLIQSTGKMDGELINALLYFDQND